MRKPRHTTEWYRNLKEKDPEQYASILARNRKYQKRNKKYWKDWTARDAVKSREFGHKVFWDHFNKHVKPNIPEYNPMPILIKIEHERVVYRHKSHKIPVPSASPPRREKKIRLPKMENINQIMVDEDELYYYMRNEDTGKVILIKK